MAMDVTDESFVGQMITPEEMLAAMGLEPDEARLVDERIKKDIRYRDGRICICGHPVSRHTEMQRGDRIAVSCKPSRMQCMCGLVIPVLDVSNTRPFVRRSVGPGKEHALTRGIEGARALGGVKMTPLVTWQCRKCGSTDEVLAAGIRNLSSGAFTVVFEGEARDNTLLCHNCRIEAPLVAVPDLGEDEGGRG